MIELSPEENETAPIDDSYSARIRQFLDSIGESLKPSRAGDATMFDLLSRSFETMQNAIAAVKLAAYYPDVVRDEFLEFAHLASGYLSRATAPCERLWEGPESTAEVADSFERL